MQNRISITGPESTAKSWLSKKLAEHYNAAYVEDYSREYLENKKIYNKEDILIIAKRQLEHENQVAFINNSLIFCDTDLLVNKIWSKYVYGECDNWIEENFMKHKYGLYLLSYPDIEWEFDPLRENPLNRMEIFDLYKAELEEAGFNYIIIDGLNNKRLENAVNAVDNYLEHKNLLND